SRGCLFHVAVAVAVAVGHGPIASGQVPAAMPPLRLLVDGVVGDGPQVADDAAVEADEVGGEKGAGRFVHEGHELIGEAGHGTGDTDAAEVGTAADARHPAALGDVAIHDRPPAADLDEALGRAVFVRKVRLLVVAGTVATFMYRLAEQPSR